LYQAAKLHTFKILENTTGMLHLKISDDDFGSAIFIVLSAAANVREI
jgi:hypothetical protein